MKHFYSFSRLAAVMLAAVLALPVWADGNPTPPSWCTDDSYTEATPIDLEATFAAGDSFNINDVFPSLPDSFFFDYGQYYDIPESDNEEVCYIEVSEPQWEREHPFYSVKLGNGFGLKKGDAHITVWYFDFYYDQLNARNYYTKKYTYNITIHITDECVPGYRRGENPDPTAAHDIMMYVGETRDNWIAFYFAGYASYNPPYQGDPATFDVTWFKIGTIEPTLSSNNPAVATTATDEHGLRTITAVAPGEAMITFTSPESSEAFTQKSVTVKVTVIDGSQQHYGEGGLYFTGLDRTDPDDPYFVAFFGHEGQLPTLVNETGSEYLTFGSYDPDIATISDDGVITLTGNEGTTTIYVQDDFYPNNHRDQFRISVQYPFNVMGLRPEPYEFSDILGDGSLSYDPATHTFTLNNFSHDYLAGHYGLEYDDLYHYIYDGDETFIDWYMEDPVHIKLVGSNEILNGERIVSTHGIGKDVIFEGNGSLYAKIYFYSFVNGVHTNSFVRDDSDWREVYAEGDTTTNITVDGASLTIERDLTYDQHYVNPYSQIISVDKLKVINKGYIHAYLTAQEKYSWVRPYECVITLKELITDETTNLYHYLLWEPNYGYTHCTCTQDQMYVSNTYFDGYYNRMAQSFEAGPTINVSQTTVAYDFSNTNPETSNDMDFKATANDSYEAGFGITMSTGHTDDEVERALRTIGPKTYSWYSALPGVLTLYLPTGSGTIRLNSQVNLGYVLKAMIVDGKKTYTYGFDGEGYCNTYSFNYQVKNSAYVVIYLQLADQAGAPARAKQDVPAQPGLILNGVETNPSYVGPLETPAVVQDPVNTEYYYSTFYHMTQNFRLTDDGTKAYYATLGEDGNLHMTLVAQNDNVILSGHPVILKSTQSVMALIPEEDTPTHTTMTEAYTASNDLIGTDEEMNAPYNCYALNDHSEDLSVNAIGFYPFSGTLVAHEAFIISSTATHPMSIVFNDTATGMDNLQQSQTSSKRLENGQLIIIRNGERYNAQGQIVK